MAKNSSLSMRPSPFLSSSEIMIWTSSSVLGFPIITITPINSSVSIKLETNTGDTSFVFHNPEYYPSLFVSNTLKAASMSSVPSVSAVLLFISITNSCSNMMKRRKSINNLNHLKIHCPWPILVHLPTLDNMKIYQSLNLSIEIAQLTLQYFAVAPHS